MFPKFFLPIYIISFITTGVFIYQITPVLAADQVVIVGDTSEPALTTAKKTTLSAEGIRQQLDKVTSLLTKEKILDPLQWAMSKQLQQQFTGNALKWLGGQLDGQNGTVQFVQDYAEYYLEAARDVGGDFVFGNQLSGLCSDEEDFVVTQEVHQFFVDTQNVTAEKFSCTDDKVEDSGNVLERMARRTFSCTSPICAQYEGKRELALRQLQVVENDEKLLGLTKGLLPQKLCESVTDASGTAHDICKLVNWPALAADTLSFNLVDLPGLQLLNMDEFNESVSNLMANLTNQALTSVTGVLGLTGNPDYSQNVFGDDGSLSYVDALLADNVSDYQSIDTNPIVDSLDAETYYFQLLSGVLNDISDVETENNNNKEQYGSCYNLELSSDLIGVKATTTTAIAIASTTIPILRGLNNQYQAATDPGVKINIINTYLGYQDQGLFRTDLQNRDYKVTFVDLDFAEMIKLFRYDMNTEINKCTGGGGSETSTGPGV